VSANTGFGAVAKRLAPPVEVAGALTLALVLVLVVLLSGAGSTKVPRRWLGAFAGYSWNGDVTSLSASWTVPHLLRESNLGKAGTWIGAQAPGNNSAPFIQIGINEERNYDALAQAMPGPPGARFHRDRYYAFWSDTPLHFHPQFLFGVHPGDRLSASLSLAHRRWTLDISDGTTLATSRFTTSQEGRGSFNQAEWLQEDVTDSVTNRLYPYPKLAGVTFVRLVVNGRRPPAWSLTSNWMSPKRGGYEVPTSLRHDAFTVAPGSLNATAAAFLGVLAPLDTESDRFENEVNAWNSHTTATLIDRQCAAEAHVLRRAEIAVAAAQWPSQIQPLVNRLIGYARGRGSELGPLSIPAPGTFSTWRATWVSQGGGIANASFEILRDLHGPEWTPY
jgi:hypothetical protein